MIDRLDSAGGPANYGFLNLGILAKSEVQAALILGSETTATRNFLDLFLAVPEDGDLRADSTAIAFCAFEREFDPLVFGRHRIFIDEQRAPLIGHDNIENAAVPKIRKGHGAPVVGIGHANGLGHIDEFAAAVVEPEVFAL